MIFLGCLLLASPAYAISERAIDFCFTTKDPKACVSTMLAEEQAQQRAVAEESLASARELARIQAQGLMLFGSGPAFINGMNNGFHQMQLPYVNTPQYQPHP